MQVCCARPVLKKGSKADLVRSPSQATDKRITIVGELVSAIRIIKMFSWEKSSMNKIYEARQAELDRIVQRAKVYARVLPCSDMPRSMLTSPFAEG